MKTMLWLLQFPLLLSLFHISSAQEEPGLKQVLEFRNLGPHKAGSWISCIAVPDSDDPRYRYTWYIGARNGGVWKTINNGTRYFQVFDSTGVSSIGAIAVSKSNPDQVWVGTGEAFNARLSHPGKGVFFSSDGGKSWQGKGLEESQHISSIIVHPENPEVVFVASMGHLFTPNSERGVFRTTDQGKNWEKVLFIDENTGIIDLIIHPNNPDILYAAAYEKYRFPWHYEAGGQNSGIYKSTDGGSRWEKLSSGLPDGRIGRIGLALCYNHPEIVYAVIENLNPKPGITVNENVAMNYMRDPYFDQLIGGEIYRSNNEGLSWEKQNQDSCNVSAKAAYSFNKIMVQPDNPDRITVSSDAMLTSLDGGKTWLDCKWPPENYFLNMFGDIRCMWVDPHDGNHMMIGSDGGLYISYDGGKNMFHHYHIPLGEIYMVEFDNDDPYHIYLGLQDHDGWKAPVNDWSGYIGPEDWELFGMWDGMYTVVDPVDKRWVYISTQFGGQRRIDQSTGTRVDIEPRAPQGEEPYRYPWTPALAISPFNSKMIYTGGQYLLRSKNRGESWERISPDLTTNNKEKIAGKGHMMYCSISSISPSPLAKSEIWVGTDDGKVHITRDNGKTWFDCTPAIEKAGGIADYWVTRVTAGRYKPGTAYVCKSGFTFDDPEAHIFRTLDYGRNWEKITDGISKAPVNVVIEDPSASDILYAGNDEGVFVSFNNGKTWQSIRLNMPVVPVKDLKIHPREKDLIVGTYGRGAFICDVSLLPQLKQNTGEQAFFLYEPEEKPVVNFSERAYWGNYEFTGDNHILTPNEENGLIVYTEFKHRPEGKALLIIQNKQSNDSLYFSPVKGLNKTVFPINRLQAGKYTLSIEYQGISLSREAVIRKSPLWPLD